MSDVTKSGSGTLGGLGFLSGLVLCGIAIVVQAAVLHAIAGKKAS